MYKKEIILAFLSFVVTASLMETYFRLFPETLPPALSNHLTSRYHDGLTGIYRYDFGLNMYLMKPNYECQMLFNGYRWHHHTNSMGFRNPHDFSRADILLLGDSMIYGHGVEETSTIRYFLNQILHQNIINMGMQGICIHQEYQLLKHFGLALHPKYVLVFFLQNDIHDLTVHLSDEEMQRFLELPVSDHTTPYSKGAIISHDWWDPVVQYLNELYLIKMGKLLKHYLTKGMTSAYAETFDEYDWKGHALFQVQPRLRLAMKFHLHALLKMQNLAQQHNMTLIHIFIYTGMNKEANIYKKILSLFCQKHLISFFSLEDGFKDAINRKQDVFLTQNNDGHFSQQGAELAAKLVAQYLQTRSE